MARKIVGSTGKGGDSQGSRDRGRGRELHQRGVDETSGITSGQGRT